VNESVAQGRRMKRDFMDKQWARSGAQS